MYIKQEVLNLIRQNGAKIANREFAASALATTAFAATALATTGFAATVLAATGFAATHTYLLMVNICQFT